MRETGFFFELSGEHHTLPRAEVFSCVRAEVGEVRGGYCGPGYQICSFPGSMLKPITDRLALVHRAGAYLGSCSPSELDDFLKELRVPEGSVAVRTRRFQKHFLRLSTEELTRRIGTAVSENREVDLETPDIEVRVLLSDALHFFISEVQIDRTQFEERKVANRPFFSPISLHPKFARALVNLTEVKRGQRLLDPFCGTGGILLEAALIGAKVFGSDISSEMVTGCKKNLDHFQADYEVIEAADVGEIRNIFPEMDAVATDPPYGRATSTNSESIESLYARGFSAMKEVLRPGGNLVMVFPHDCPPPPECLILREKHVQRVHKSLSRSYCKFQSRHSTRN